MPAGSRLSSAPSMSPPASSSAAEQPGSPAGGRGLVLILGVLTALGPLAVDMYLPALPEIARELGADGGAVQLTLSVFMVGMALGQGFYGPVADRCWPGWRYLPRRRSAAPARNP